MLTWTGKQMKECGNFGGINGAEITIIILIFLLKSLSINSLDNIDFHVFQYKWNAVLRWYHSKQTQIFHFVWMEISNYKERKQDKQLLILLKIYAQTKKQTNYEQLIQTFQQKC